MRMLARISALAACAGWLLGAAGIAGAHQTALAPMTGLAMFLVGVACAATALMAGLAALGASFARGPRSARPAAATAVVVAALAVVPAALALSRWMRIAHPPLCDVTTDIANPPQFLDAHGAPLAAMQYDRRLSPIQLRYYPALAPLRLDETPDRAFARVERAAGAPHAAGPMRAKRTAVDSGWGIVAIDPAARRIEGFETSWLFRFRDDFAIEVRPGRAADQSVVEMRSRSRDGRRDFGSNYNRIREFFALVRADFRRPANPASRSDPGAGGAPPPPRGIAPVATAQLQRRASGHPELREPLMCAEPEFLEVLGQLAHHVPRLAFDAARAAEQVLQRGENRDHRTFGFDFVGQRCDQPDLAHELLLMDLAHAAARTIEELPQRLEPGRQLRVDVGRFVCGKAVAQLLEDGEGERLGAPRVASDARRDFLEK